MHTARISDQNRSTLNLTSGHRVHINMAIILPASPEKGPETDTAPTGTPATSSETLQFNTERFGACPSRLYSISCPTTVELRSTFTSKKKNSFQLYVEYLAFEICDIYRCTSVSTRRSTWTIERDPSHFLSALPSEALEGICLPTHKPLSDRLKKIVGDYKTESQYNGTACCII